MHSSVLLLRCPRFISQDSLSIQYGYHTLSSISGRSLARPRLLSLCIREDRALPRTQHRESGDPLRRGALRQRRSHAVVARAQLSRPARDDKDDSARPTKRRGRKTAGAGYAQMWFAPTPAEGGGGGLRSTGGGGGAAGRTRIESNKLRSKLVTVFTGRQRSYQSKDKPKSYVHCNSNLGLRVLPHDSLNRKNIFYSVSHIVLG